ncbi:MAG: hypothetical protein LUC06_00900 [Oscillospiraceae bacterium]|nr:hypothetical protein [Oscillospiraceae bacterium]
MKPCRKIVALLCALWMLFSMSGCRDSAVVERMVYDYIRAHQTDEEKITYDDQEGHEADDKLHALETNELSDREQNEDASAPVLAPEETPTTEERAGVPDYAESGVETGAASVELSAASEGVVSGAASTETTEESTADAESVPETGDALSADVSGEHGTTGGTSTRLVVDDYGQEYELPENVNSVAAVDSAALAVLMLGGAARLLAADEALLSNELAQDIFSGLDGVSALWSGDGTEEPLDDAAFDALLSLHPDVCFETSGDASFTDAQVEALAESGIAYVVLPVPEGSGNLCLIAQIIGTVLGDHSDEEDGYDSLALADAYRSYVNETVEAVTDAGGAASYTIYVDDWDETAYYSIAKADGYKGYGVAVLQNAKTASCRAVSGALADANVTNVTSLGAFVRTETVYFTPINYNTTSITVSGVAAARLTPLNLLALAGGGLGAANFQTVIASSARGREALEENLLWSNFGIVHSTDGNFYGSGFLDDNGVIVTTTVTGDYSVLVNPRGLGDWAGGSLESVLETVWAAYAVTGVYSVQQVRDAVLEFYSTFYHYALSDEQIDRILDGDTGET